MRLTQGFALKLSSEVKKTLKCRWNNTKTGDEKGGLKVATLHPDEELQPTISAKLD